VENIYQFINPNRDKINKAKEKENCNKQVSPKSIQEEQIGNDPNKTDNFKCTRSGRVVKQPRRFLFSEM